MALASTSVSNAFFHRQYRKCGFLHPASSCRQNGVSCFSSSYRTNDSNDSKVTVTTSDDLIQNQRINNLALRMSHSSCQPPDSSSPDPSSSSEELYLEDLRLRMTLGFSNKETIPEDVFTVVYRASDADNTFAYLSYDGSVMAFESEIECARFCIALKEEKFIDPMVREMKLSTLKEHCESLDGVEIRPIPAGADTKVPPGRSANDQGTNSSRDAELELVNRLYKISTWSSDDQFVEEYSVRNGGGSWE